MGQNYQKLKQNCLIDGLYGTKQVENKAKLSHRIVETALYGTKLSKIEAKLSHRRALWDKTSRKVSETVP
jgi:hypothetical protein